MSDVWDEFGRRVDAWRALGDRERLRLLDLYNQAMRLRETDPDRQFDLLTRARDEARRLEEPWWVLFLEKWRLDTITSGKHDFATALPLAIELMTRFSGPEGRAHPFYDSVLGLVLYVYGEMDPFGYRDEIERGSEILDARDDASNDQDNRFVLNYRKASYLIHTERWDEAYELAHWNLDMANHRDNLWHGAWALFLLCRICHSLKLPDELAEHADAQVEQSAGSPDLLRTLADGWLWRAFAQLSEGDRTNAARSLQNGMRHIEKVERRDEISAEPIAAYYELLGDAKAALGVLDRQLGDLTKSGANHRAALVHIERCRLLKLAGELSEGDVNRSREAARRMRQPSWYLEKLELIVGSGPPPLPG
jgi:hypothetical protein